MILRGREYLHTSSDDIEEVALFWEKMDEVYGAKFKSQYGDSVYSDNGELTADARRWSKYLNQLNRQQLMRALERIAHDFREKLARNEEAWPPTPMKFFAMAKDTTAVDWEHRRTNPQLPPNYSRPALEHSREKVQTKCAMDWIADMKKTVGLK